MTQNSANLFSIILSLEFLLTLVNSKAIPLRYNNNLNGISEEHINLSREEIISGSNGISNDNPTFSLTTAWALNILGIAFIALSFITSWFCCAKKRSGSYGEPDDSKGLQIYRLKSDKRESEIPTPAKEQTRIIVTPTDSKINTQKQQQQRQQSSNYLRSDSPNVPHAPNKSPRESPQLVRITTSNIENDKKWTKMIVKDDISPPIIQTTNSQDKSNTSSSSLPFKNPDPLKEPLKPFTYSPIPPSRPQRNKSNVSTTSSNKSTNKDVVGHNNSGKTSPTTKSNSGLPFSNPDPLREPLKPFTYSPIPV